MILSTFLSTLAPMMLKTATDTVLDKTGLKGNKTAEKIVQTLNQSATIDAVAHDPIIIQKAQDIMGERIKQGGATVRAEIASQSWLGRNWRPMTMLILVGLVAAQAFGFTADSMTQDQALAILDIVYFGLGGYVLGRSAEKTVPALAQILRRA